MNLWNYLFGFRKIRVKSVDYERVRVALVSGNLPFRHFRVDEDGCEFYLSEIYRKRFLTVFSGFGYSTSSIMGLPAFLLRYKSRYGIAVGLFAFLLVLRCFDNYIWDIRVICDESISEESVIQNLSASGFSIGSDLDDLDFDILNNHFLSESEDIAWISVNMSGVVANVEVRGYKTGALTDNGVVIPRNLVASQDGQIAVITLRSGKRVVEVGQIVRKGELLISGVIDSQSLGVRYERADGEVLAYVDKEISVEVPLESTEKVFTDREFKKIFVNIFGKSINIFSNCRNSASSCDRINTVYQIKLLGRFSIPVFVEEIVFREYFEQVKLLDISEAVEIANAKLAAELRRALENAELVSKKITIDSTDEAVRITCVLYCIENIAEPIEFKIS